MKTAFVFDGLPTCGGVKVPFEYASRMKDTYIVANNDNLELQKYYGVERKPMAFLFEFTPEDNIIMCWWPQEDVLRKFEGRKVQFLQGNDLDAYSERKTREECLATRQREDWELLAVSEFAGKWTNRPFTVVPNGLPERFFVEQAGHRDIDILIEGRYEPNKGIDEAIVLAKRTGAKKIAWLGVDAFDLGGVAAIKNPPQEEIPNIYRHAKVFLKLSKSEGFCLPILEAMASGCLVVTHDMGGNDFCTAENSILDNHTDHIDRFLAGDDYSEIIKKGRKTAEEMTWEKSVAKMEAFLSSR